MPGRSPPHDSRHQSKPQRFRAWLRCQPVVAHNSSSIRPFAAFPERFYLVAIATDTAYVCANVSPITRA